LEHNDAFDHERPVPQVELICFFLVVGALSIAGETCQHGLTGHACSHAFVIFKAAAARDGAN
jgi:hypothetical protein